MSAAIDLTPDSPDLRALQRQAEREGREVVVGAIIVNPRGQAFAQRRAPHRRLFPGCWDIAGGHVEPEETLYAALAREIGEETGWQLRALVDLVAIIDWETAWAGSCTKRREFDFLVAVDGDLEHPRLEWDKVTEFRWLAVPELDVLREHRAPADLAVYGIVKQGLECHHRTAWSPPSRD